MHVLIIGFGSIGERHAQILNNMGYEVSIVSQRKNLCYETFRSVKAAFAGKEFEYVIICNKTAEHWKTLKEVALYYEKDSPILIEKPVINNMREFEREILTSKLDFSRVFVGYNLRFHPMIEKIGEIVEGKNIITVQIYCGQYLPTWRRNRDYRTVYSANKCEGGGVLRDLSHEFDYAQWLFGEWEQVSALGGKYSTLEIESEDCCGVLCRTTRVPIVTIQINYLDRLIQREIIINTDTSTYKADLILGTITGNDVKGKVVDTISSEINESYAKMHAAILNGETDVVCSWEEALNTVKMIEAIEESISSRCNVMRR